jgi:hypothetical protein
MPRLPPVIKTKGWGVDGFTWAPFGVWVVRNSRMRFAYKSVRLIQKDNTIESAYAIDH